MGNTIWGDIGLCRDYVSLAALGFVTSLSRSGRTRNASCSGGLVCYACL